jgi:hypothetical protein
LVLKWTQAKRPILHSLTDTYTTKEFNWDVNINEVLVQSSLDIILWAIPFTLWTHSKLCFWYFTTKIRTIQSVKDKHSFTIITHWTMVPSCWISEKLVQ